MGSASTRPRAHLCTLLTLAVMLLVGGLTAAPASASVEQASTTEPRELVELRTAHSRTVLNGDGTRTTSITPKPRHYKAADDTWQPIDNRLVPTGLGGYRNKANSFTTEFAPLPTAVSLTTPEGALTMAPIGAAAALPEAAGDTVTYQNAWPGVDLRYSVQPDGVKEDIVVRQRPVTNRFSFAVAGGALQAAPDGGLVLAGGDWSTWRVMAPEVLDSLGTPISAAAPTFSLTEAAGHTVLDVEVDAAWLASLPDSAFPITIDPTLYSVGSPNSNSYKSDGYSCTPCPIRVGNPNEPNRWVSWRGVAYFPYENLYGKEILRAQAHVWHLTGGTLNGNWIDVYHGAWDWPTLHSGLLANQWHEHDFWFEGNLRGFYQDLVNRRAPGAALKFLVMDQNGIYSYKQLSAFELHLTWQDFNRPPHIPHSRTPGSGWVGRGEPELCATYHDPDGNGGNVDFDIAGVGFFPVGTSQDRRACFRPGYLGDGTYRWRVRAWDGSLVSDFSDWWTFRVDRSGPPPPAVGSSTHPEGQWRPSRTAEFSWPEPYDPSGVAGYAVRFDQSSGTEPPGSAETGQRTWRQEDIADGDHWLHVRAVDGLDNPGGTRHYHVRVDATAPLSPDSVTSASHRRAWPTADSTIDMTWTEGFDAHSGVAGYSWAFTPSQTAEADGSADGSQLAATSAPLAAGRWWFHVRSVDVAGNVGPDVAYGPFEVNPAAIALPYAPAGVDQADEPCVSTPDYYDTAGCAAPADLSALPEPEPLDGARRLHGYNGPYYSPLVAGGTVRVLDGTVRSPAPAEGGTWSAAGLVRNETAAPATNVTVTARLFGVADLPLGEVTATVPVRTLRPHEPAPFEMTSTASSLLVLRVEYVVRYDVAATAGPRSLVISELWREPYNDRAPIVDDFYSDPASGPLPTLLSGSVANQGEEVSNPGVVAAWLDDSGRVIDVATAPLGGSEPLTSLGVSHQAHFVVAEGDDTTGPQIENAAEVLLWAGQR